MILVINILDFAVPYLIWWCISLLIQYDPYLIWWWILSYYWFDDPYLMIHIWWSILIWWSLLLLIWWSIFSICFRSSWHLWGDKTQIRYPERSQPVPVGPQNSNLMRCWMPRLSKKSIEKPWKSCWLWLVHANSQIMTILIISGWWFEPLWKILVSWDDYFQYMEKSKNVPNHQPDTPG